MLMVAGHGHAKLPSDHCLQFLIPALFFLNLFVSLALVLALGPESGPGQ